MAFFQNPFDFEFRPTLLGSDRQYSQTFSLKANRNFSGYMANYAGGPTWALNGNDLEGNPKNVLTFHIATDPEFLQYHAIPVTITAASLAATTVDEVVSSLNANVVFAQYYLASKTKSGIKDGTNPTGVNILIQPIVGSTSMRTYISNYGAETVFLFNKHAPIKELPNLFKQYAVSQINNYPDRGADRLILLDPANDVDAAVITAAGFNPAAPKADWQLLAGANDGYFTVKTTYDTNLKVEVKYFTGALAGSPAKKTYYTYSGGNLTGMIETPHVLESGDIIAPP